MTRKINYTFIPRDWLVGEWLLDWNTNDTSWNWNNGTATDVSWVNARRWYINKCASFNWSSSKLDTNYNIPSSSTTYSVWWWYRLDSADNYWVLLSQWTTTNSTNKFNIEYSSAVRFAIHDWDWNTYAVEAWDIDWKWHYYMWTFDWSNVKFYDNWILQWTTSFSWSNDLSSDSMRISSYSNDDTCNINWDCWNVLAINKALSADNVKLLYELTSKKYIYPFAKYTPASLSKPILYIDWTNDWTTWYDQSGNGNNATQSWWVTTWRIGQSEYMSFDWNNDYIYWSNNNLKSLQEHTYIIKIKRKWNWNNYWRLFQNWDVNTWITITQSSTTSNILYRIIIWWTRYEISQSNATMSSDKYDSFAFRYNGSSIDIFQNWVLTDTLSVSWTIDTATWSNYSIWWDSTGSAFNWNLLDIKLYDQALTQEQIQQEYYSNYIN